MDETEPLPKDRLLPIDPSWVDFPPTVQCSGHLYSVEQITALVKLLKGVTDRSGISTFGDKFHYGMRDVLLALTNALEAAAQEPGRPGVVDDNALNRGRATLRQTEALQGRDMRGFYPPPRSYVLLTLDVLDVLAEHRRQDLVNAMTALANYLWAEPFVDRQHQRAKGYGR